MVKIGIDTITDDLRVRQQFLHCFTHEQPSFPPWLNHPYTVFLGLRQGDAVMELDRRERGLVRLHPGDTILVPANTRRHTRTLSAGGAEIIATGYLFEIRGGIDLMRLLTVPNPLSQATRDRLFGLLEELRALVRATPRTDPLLKSVTVQRVGYAILEGVLGEAALRPGALGMRRVFPAIERLNREYAARPDIPELIRESGLSRRHFFRMFKEQTGTTPFDFVKQRRLREALLLLQESDLTVAEIGDQVGWPDPFYFSKLFKAGIGMAPTEYRRQYGGGGASVTPECLGT